MILWNDTDALRLGDYRRSLKLNGVISSRSRNKAVRRKKWPAYYDVLIAFDRIAQCKMSVIFNNLTLQ